MSIQTWDQEGWVCPGGDYPHPDMEYQEIRLASGQYASYWNAFLFKIIPISFMTFKPCRMQGSRLISQFKLRSKFPA